MLAFVGTPFPVAPTSSLLDTRITSCEYMDGFRSHAHKRVCGCGHERREEWKLFIMRKRYYLYLLDGFMVSRTWTLHSSLLLTFVYCCECDAKSTVRANRSLCIRCGHSQSLTQRSSA